MSRCSAPCSAATDAHSAMPHATTTADRRFIRPSLSLCSLALPGLLGAGERAKPDTTGRYRGRDIPPAAAIPERGDVHRDGVSHLDHVVAVARAVHVVRAMTLEHDVALALVVLHMEHELHVRVDGAEFLDDTGDGLAPGEVELDGRMVGHTGRAEEGHHHRDER